MVQCIADGKDELKEIAPFKIVVDGWVLKVMLVLWTAIEAWSWEKGLGG